MSEQKEINGKFRYERDSKRFHRFKIETEEELPVRFMCHGIKPQCRKKSHWNMPVKSIDT